jgi:hypothetical protein
MPDHRSDFILLFAAAVAGGIVGWSAANVWNDACRTSSAEAERDGMLSQQAAVTAIVDKAAGGNAAIQIRTETILKEVPVYVPRDTPCRVPDGYVRLLDATAKGDVPVSGTAAKPDDSTSSTANQQSSTVTLTDSAALVVGNYGICHQNAEQLRALQAWVMAVQESGR